MSENKITLTPSQVGAFCTSFALGAAIEIEETNLSGGRVLAVRRAGTDSPNARVALVSNRGSVTVMHNGNFEALPEGERVEI